LRDRILRSLFYQMECDMKRTLDSFGANHLTALRRLFKVALLFVACAMTASGQSVTSPTDGHTPLGLEAGAPAGSYALSGFDNINLFNGNLNFRMPLLHIGGRGSAQMTVMLPLELKWSVYHWSFPGIGSGRAARSPGRQEERLRPPRWACYRIHTHEAHLHYT
jgi:hypothetical protein